MKRSMMAVCTVVLILAQPKIVPAARKPMQAPAPAVFTPEKYLADTYKDALAGAIRSSDALADAGFSSLLKSLYKITREDKALNVINILDSALLAYKDKKPDAYRSIRDQLTGLRSLVASRDFNNHETGIDFKVDAKNRRYVISWPGEVSGTDEIKIVPMPPVMDMVVNATYVPIDRRNQTVLAYRYWVTNSAANRAKIFSFNVLNTLDVSAVGREVERKFGKMWPTFKVADNIELNVKYPMGEVTYYNFTLFRIKEETSISTKPGNQNEHPYELEGLENSLPGIVGCFVDLIVDGGLFEPYSPLTSEDPKMAIDTFLDDNPTCFQYTSNTIGPVPVPSPLDKLKFIDQIIAYNTQAITEGWNDNQTVINFTQTGMADIKNNPNSKDKITAFLSSLESYFKAKQIQPEGYVLLKYNLEYLLKQM